MSTKLAKIIADFRTSLATEIAIGGTTGSLQSATDDDGVALPTGVYFFTIDGDNSSKEHIKCTCTAGALTGIYSISRQGVQTSGTVRKHRIGASVVITDFAHIAYLNDLLLGTTDLDHSTPLKYDGTASITDDAHLCTKKYADDLAIAGAPNASTTVKGIVEIATGAELAAGTGTGGTGAILVSAGSSFKNSSAGSGDANKVPVLDSNGLLDQSFMPISILSPTGVVVPFAGPTTSVPSGWLLCDGSAVSRSTYATLFALLFPSLGTFTVTIASPGVVSLTAHGLSTGDGVYLTTTGALPTGLSANTRYWIIKNDADSFWLATSLANALAGTKINTSGSQSGTHTCKRAPYGIGDGSTTFNLPSMKGNVPVGKDTSQTEFAGLGQTGGEKTHTLTIAEMPSHDHPIGYASNAGSNTNYAKLADNTSPGSTSDTITNTGGDGAHNNLQPYLVLNYIIKT